MSENILEMKGITKIYPGVRALDDVSLAIRRGEVHGLCGENGAGKSTLIKILYGAECPNAGKIVINGAEVTMRTPEDGVKNGISVVNQELKLAEHLTVGENIYLGHMPERGIIGLRFVKWKELYRKAQELIERLNIDLDVHARVATMSVAKKQIVEIAKALSYDSEILIMDEPSASLTDNELDTLFNIIDILKKSGVTILYISHRLDEIFKITDRVSVLRDGKYIATKDTAQTDKHELISLMVGRELGNEYPKVVCATDEVRLEVQDICTPMLKNVSFKAYRGEVLGIAGLVGAGRTELARAVFGADRVTSGRILIDGKEVRIKSVNDAIAKNIALIPEERKSQGVILNLTVRENISLINIKKYVRGLFISKSAERSDARKYSDMLRIKTPGIETTVQSLSGGNQQKVVLAKWLGTNSDIIFFDEPTRGIDVGAKVEIYNIINDFAKQGKTIIMISSELPEVIGMCDRVIVMHDGAVSGVLKREELSQERILEAAIS